MTRNFELTGYESVYFIRNLGSLYLLFILTFIALLLLAATSCSQNAKVQEYRQIVKDKLFWNGVLSFIEANYLTICVCFCLNMAVLYDETTPDRHAGSVFSLITAIASEAVLFCLPIFVGVYVSWNIDKIYECDFDFKQKFGVVFEELNVKRLGNYAFAFPAC